MRATAFHFDNEAPQHRALTQDMRIARALVTNAEWLEFIADGGYAKPSLWLSDGWATARSGRLAGAGLLARDRRRAGIR